MTGDYREEKDEISFCRVKWNKSGQEMEREEYSVKSEDIETAFLYVNAMRIWGTKEESKSKINVRELDRLMSKQKEEEYESKKR